MSDTRVRRRVLLADDDAALRRLITATLGTEDFELLNATDGAEALAVIRDMVPDIVLLDVTMPRLSGIEVCKQIKSDPSTAAVKVLLLTARTNESDRARGIEAGADDYFVKPFSPVKLLNKVYALLESRANHA